MLRHLCEDVLYRIDWVSVSIVLVRGGEELGADIRIRGIADIDRKSRTTGDSRGRGYSYVSRRCRLLEKKKVIRIAKIVACSASSFLITLHHFLIQNISGIIYRESFTCPLAPISQIVKPFFFVSNPRPKNHLYSHQLVTLTPRPRPHPRPEHCCYWCPTPAPLLTTWRKSVLLSNVSKRHPNTIGTQFQIWNLLYVRLIMCFETPLYSVLLTTVNNNTLNKTISLPSLLSPHFKFNSYNCHNSLK
jgi:hypothetical protein